MTTESSDIFDQLFEVIRQRKGQSPDSSYVARLMDGGADRIGGKIREEADEFIEAAEGDDHAHTVYELCDLLFHAFVLAGHKDVELSEVRAELERRFGTSGLTEKANRSTPGS